MHKYAVTKVVKEYSSKELIYRHDPQYNYPAKVKEKEWAIPTFLCLDCGMNTKVKRESYMVRDNIWPIGNLDGCLCIGCLEYRIGYQLQPDDFTPVPLNYHWRYLRSERLIARLGLKSVLFQGNENSHFLVSWGEESLYDFLRELARRRPTYIFNAFAKG